MAYAYIKKERKKRNLKVKGLAEGMVHPIRAFIKNGTYLRARTNTYPRGYLRSDPALSGFQPYADSKKLQGGKLDDEKQNLIAALMESAPVPVEFCLIADEASGLYDPYAKKILIDLSFPGWFILKTLVHEISHALLHDGLGDFPVPPGTRCIEEVQAESIACVVCAYFGMDTSAYSFDYIASWCSGEDIRELTSSLEVIWRTASEIIGRAEKILRRKDMKRPACGESLAAGIRGL